MWSTCVFYVIPPTVYKSFLMQSFPIFHKPSVTLQWLTQDWYAVVICALKWCSVKISSIQIHGNEKFNTGGERKETINSGAFLCFSSNICQNRNIIIHK